MKTSALPWIGGALLASCALALAWSARPGRVADAAGASAASTDAAAAATPASDDELRQLRAQVAAMRSELAASGRRADAAPSDPSASPDQARRHAERDRQRHAAYVDSLQSSFRLEPTDARWSAATSSRLLDALQRNDALRGAARDVQCRSSSCRIELSLDPGGAVDKQLPLWSQQFADVLPRMVGQAVVRPNGERAMVLYLLGPQPPAAAPKG